MRSLIILFSECGDLLDCSVYGALSYYVQNMKTYETVQYAESYHTTFRMWRSMRLFSMRSVIVLSSTHSTSQCELPWCHSINMMHNRPVIRATQITSLPPRTSIDVQRSRGTISSRSLSANHIKACGCYFISPAIPPKSMTVVLVVLPFNTITLAVIYDNWPFANAENSL